MRHFFLWKYNHYLKAPYYKLRLRWHCWRHGLDFKDYIDE